MNPSQPNGINPAMLAAYGNNQSQSQQPQFSLPNQYGQQQQPSYPQPNKFQYNNGTQYPNMYQGGNNQSANPPPTMQGGVHQNLNPAQMMNNSRGMPAMNPAQLATMYSGNKPNMGIPGGNTNGMNPANSTPGGPNPSNSLSAHQIATLASLSGQDRQKAMLYLQHHQKQLNQQTQVQNPQQQQQPPQMFDRPPSAMSGQQPMMMPPPPRPPTSMSRPGTANSHGSSQQPRPPSRSNTAQQNPGMQQPGFPMPGTPNPGMQQPLHIETPGSPYRGAKRKLSANSLPVMQPPRVANSQGMPIVGIPNMQPDGPMNMNGQFSPGMGPQQQSQRGAGGSGMMGGAGGGMMAPPAMPRPNQQQLPAQQQQPIDLQQTFQAAADRSFSGGDSSPTNFNSFMNGLHPQAGSSNGMMAGVPPGIPASMLSQLQQQQQHPNPSSPSANTANFGQILDDPRLSSISANAMASLMGSVPGSIGKMNAGMETPPRPPQLSATNSLSSSYPSAASSSSAMPPMGLPSISRAPPAPLHTTAALNPKVTQISAISLADAVKEIPELTDDEISDVKEWMHLDREYEARYKAMRERMGDEVNSIIRYPEWWERDEAAAAVSRNRRDKFSIGLPAARVGRRKGRIGIRLPRKIATEDANKPELLIPVRLELDIDHHRMRDTFVWNLNDPVVTPEMFAQSIVEDYNLPSSSLIAITRTIQEQLSDFQSHAGEDESLVNQTQETVKGTLDDNEAIWWEGWKKRLRTENGFVRRKKRKTGFDLYDDEELALHGDVEAGDDEMRILIKLDIIVGSIRLEDQFEWDIQNVDGGAPEKFAEVYSKELGLSGEFKTAIAHSIREQSHAYQKSLFLAGNPADGTLVDEDLRTSFLPSLSSGVARPLDQVPAFTPLLNYLSDGEIERNEKEREKDLNRRRRKTTRGRRGIAMPDREPLKTCRTPAIGFPEVDSSMVNAAIAPPTTKRAAAAAASLTIANMVASENGTALIQPSTPMSMPAMTPAHQQKDKKPRGLFKPPSYPPSVLRPRANVVAPTQSTGLGSSKPPASKDVGSLAPESSRGPNSRALNMKKARELEKEAREREYMDGQHPNWIDGVWHCSNCGCPESIAIGRRKGPLGDKSQCGTCGKYWHRHRRPRPVEYSSDIQFHQNQRVDVEQTRVTATRRRRNVIADSSDQSMNAQEDDDETLTSIDNILQDGGFSAPPVDRPVSPASSDSSGSESPLAQRVRMNGRSSTMTPVPTSNAEAASVDDPEHDPSQSAIPNPTTPQRTSGAPDWLNDAVANMLKKYPDDRFGVVLRPAKPGQPEPPGWRIKCHDCPGKLYTAGPGNTLSNFEVHLKNRQHRMKVATRVGGGAVAPA